MKLKNNRAAGTEGLEPEGTKAMSGLYVSLKISNLLMTNRNILKRENIVLKLKPGRKACVSLEESFVINCSSKNRENN